MDRREPLRRRGWSEIMQEQHQAAHSFFDQFDANQAQIGCSVEEDMRFVTREVALKDLYKNWV